MKQRYKEDWFAKALNFSDKHIYPFWLVLYPVLIKGIFVFYYVPDVINPQTRLSAYFWFFISVAIIISSLAASFHGIKRILEEG